MMQYFILRETDSAHELIWKIKWNIREDKADYDYEPTKEEMLNFRKASTTMKDKIINYISNIERKKKFKKILKNEIPNTNI